MNNFVICLKEIFNRSAHCILFSLATRVGSSQKRQPITVGPYHVSHPVNFPCGGKPKKSHDVRHSLDYTFSHEDWVQVHLNGDRTRGLRDEGRVV